ncbi:MAG: DUF3987 domain-containing protein [Actinobacteria bacterium]|nr:DUF3987 domain-containing protein [Actinomycetota bacterium]
MTTNPEQPAIADILGITYERPISDERGWADAFSDISLAPAPPAPEVFHGPLGDLTRAIAPHVPWDPIAFHMQALVAIGSHLGYTPHVDDGANQRRANLFLAIVGGTAIGKGSSLGFTHWLLGHIDDEFRTERLITQIGSGEGLLAKITDTVYTQSPRGDQVVAMAGSDDKRVLYIEEELGGLFNKMISQESVEKTITKAWDSGVLETTTKKESMRCKEPHVSIIGHITPDELYDRLDKRLLDNGFSNRWLYVMIKKTAVVPQPPAPRNIPGADGLAEVIAENIRANPLLMSGPVKFTAKATTMFNATHGHMSDYRFAGAMGKQSARWAPQIYKLAIIYAAIDGAKTIDVPHLAAARAAWAYSHRSASAFFSGMTGNQYADQFLDIWRSADYAAVTLTDIDEMFNKNMSAAKRTKMLERLTRDGVVSRTQVTSPNGGRPATVVSFNGLTDEHAPAAKW